MNPLPYTSPSRAGSYKIRPLFLRTEYNIIARYLFMRRLDTGSKRTGHRATTTALSRELYPFPRALPVSQTREYVAIHLRIWSRSFTPRFPHESLPAIIEIRLMLAEMEVSFDEAMRKLFNSSINVVNGKQEVLGGTNRARPRSKRNADWRKSRGRGSKKMGCTQCWLQ